MKSNTIPVLLIDILITNEQFDIIKTASYCYLRRITDIPRLDFYRRNERAAVQELWDVIKLVPSYLPSNSDFSERGFKLTDKQFDLLLEQMLQLNIRTPFEYGNVRSLKRYRDVTNLTDILWSQLPAGSKHNKIEPPIYDE